MIENLIKQKMGNPIFQSCCNCQTLRIGSVIAGAAAILLSIVSLIVMFTVRVAYRSIFFDWLPPYIVKIIIAFNLLMTILISAIMIVGALKVCYKLHIKRMKTTKFERKTDIFFKIAAKSLFDVAMGGSWRNISGRNVDIGHLHWSRVHSRWLDSNSCSLAHMWSHSHR